VCDDSGEIKYGGPSEGLTNLLCPEETKRSNLRRSQMGFNKLSTIVPILVSSTTNVKSHALIDMCHDPIELNFCIESVLALNSSDIKGIISETLEHHRRNFHIIM
jgi:hypothetical protein